MRTKYAKVLALIAAFVVHLALAQERTITGTVTDHVGSPLIGVTILHKKTSRGTLTDFDGKYAIPAENSHVLIFSHLGFVNQEIPVGAQTIIDLQMQPDTAALDEVVIVGYGNQQKRKIIQNVSVVGAEAMREIPALAPQDLLQGQSSGLQITGSSGVLGAASVMRIRGVGSLSGGSQPLVVIDGVPLNDQNTRDENQYTQDLGGTIGINPLAYLNTNDIASVTVLKDAAATAIYGSRGANGVILIATKTGKLNTKTQVTLDVYSQFERSTDELEMLSADQYRQFITDRENTQNPNSPIETPQSLGLGALGSPGFDWTNAVNRTGISHHIDLSAKGGSQNTSFYLGTSFNDQKGFIIGNNLQKIGGRLNVAHKAKSWLDLGMNLAMTNTRINRVFIENETGAPFTSAYLQKPIVFPTDEVGEYVDTGFFQNVIAIADLETNLSESDRFLGTFHSKIKLFEHLDYKASFGIDRLTVEETQRSPELLSPGGFGLNRIVSDRKWLNNHSLNYANTFADRHNVNALALISYEESLFSRTHVEGTGFASDALRNVESAATKTITSHIRNQWGLFSVLGRISYDYQGKYILEGSLRRDGSSRFGANNRYGNFWAAAGGWVLSKEKFVQEASWITYLSLRASYGTSGNDRLGFYPALGLYGAGTPGAYNGTPGLIPNQIENPNLKWEESKTFDIGVKTSFLDGRIAFDANYFIKNTSDLLLNQTVPHLTGYSSFPANVGSMENRGVELDLRTVNFQKKHFEWNTNFNISFINNEVLSLPGAAEDPDGRPFLVGGSSVQRAIVGQNINTFYLVRYQGVNPTTGDAEWLDQDGNPTTSWNSGNRVITGSALPDFYGGITNSLRYKKFDLNFLMNFSVGNDIYYSGLRFLDDPVSDNNKRTETLDVWKNPGDQANTPSFVSPTLSLVSQRSTRQLKDGSFLRMKNLSLGYTLDQNILGSVDFIAKMRIYVTGTNLFTFKNKDLRGLDPEVTDNISPLVQGESFLSAPQSKSYLLGVRMNF